MIRKQLILWKEDKFMNLQGNKILFICASFFDYSYIIKKKLEQMGAKVELYDERPSNNFFSKSLIRVFPKLSEFYCNRYYDKILKESKVNNYDYLIIIKGEAISVKSLKKFKKEFANTKFILYLWDKTTKTPFFEEKREYFDSVLSFDKEDCNKFKMRFRPLFYTVGNNETEVKKVMKYDLLFIGTIDTKRYKILEEIKKICEYKQIKTNFIYFLPSKFLFFYYKFFSKDFHKAKIKDFSFTKLNHQENSTLMLNSNAILDIARDNQIGLTIRTIETLGLKKKLITFNENVKSYDFYFKENINVMNENEMILDENFLKIPYKELSEDLYYFYSIEGWISDLLKI